MKRNRPAHTAFEEVYRRQRPRVWRYVLTATRGDLDLAEDLVGETFLRMFRTYNTQISRMRASELESVLITVAKRCVVDRWRQDTGLVFRDEYLEDDIPVGGLPTSEDDRFDRVLGDDLVGRFLAAASTRLTHGQWRVIYMAAAMGMKPAEIALTLNTTPATVRTQLSAARKILQVCAVKDGVDLTFSDADVVAGSAAIGVEQKSPVTGIGEMTV